MDLDQNYSWPQLKILEITLRYFTLVVMAATLSSPALHAEEIEFESSEVWIHTNKGPVHFFVQLAVTPEQRRHGLMFRSDMPSDMGMLFDFGQEIQLAMWMKNTFIPLDMIFVDKQGRIHKIARNTVPLSLKAIPSVSPTFAVLELNAGITRKLEIEVGNLIAHKIFDKD